MKELIFGLIGGTALLMYGVDKMGEGLEKVSGEMMKKILSVLTGNVWFACLVGTAVTVLVQSSTAITVLTVGFVNSGLMKLPQAIGIIYGANIGTTVTAQLMAFSFHFKLTDIALPVLGVGFAINYLVKHKTLKNFGEALFGFGVMFLGLKILNGGVPYMQDNETLKYFFRTYASNPFIGILLGAVATALVHSSSATVALVMMLGKAGLIDLQTSICIMLGDNIGTCITAQLASATANIHARRTAWAHTLYNVIGVLIVAVTLHWFRAAVEFATSFFQHTTNLDIQIANSHTIFNVLSAVVFLPITKYYVRFLEVVIRSRNKEDETGTKFLDNLLLDTPIAALKATLSEVIRGTELSREMIVDTMDMFFNKNDKKLKIVQHNEETINQLQKGITSYIIDLSKKQLTESQSVMVPAMINNINNIERVGDHAMDILTLAQQRIDKKLKFSDKALEELKYLQSIIIEMLDSTVTALKNSDMELAQKVIKLEDKVDEVSKILLESHLKRLEKGKCDAESAVLYLDIVNHFERIADHIYKVSVSATDELKGIRRTV